MVRSRLLLGAVLAVTAPVLCCQQVRAQFQNEALEPAMVWEAPQPSASPWQKHTGSELATPVVIADDAVRPADYRSVSKPDFIPPALDSRTAAAIPALSMNGHAEIENGGGPSIQIDVADAEQVAENPGPLWAGIREWIGSQPGSVNWTRMLGSLGIVVAGYLVLVWLFRLAGPKGNGRLPATVFELVGSARLNSRQSLQLVRIGGRLLMLIVSPEGAQPVGEISHPGEVESLVAQCNTRGGAGKRSALSPRPSAVALEQLVAALQRTAGNPSGNHEFEA